MAIIQYQKRTRRQNSVKRYLETGSFLSPQKKIIETQNRLSGKIGFVKFKVRSLI